MSGKVMAVVFLLFVLLASAAASPPLEARHTGVLQQLLAKKESASSSGYRPDPAPRAQLARAQRRPHMTEDEREIMSKQIMQAISEVMSSDCVLDRDYQGWLDFGRREAE